MELSKMTAEQFLDAKCETIDEGTAGPTRIVAPPESVVAMLDEFAKGRATGFLQWAKTDYYACAGNGRWAHVTDKNCNLTESDLYELYEKSLNTQ